MSTASEVTIVDQVNRFILMQEKVTIDKENVVNLADVAIAVDRNARCHLSLDDGFDESKGWECSIACKEFTDEQKEALLQMNGTFDNSVETI